MVITESGKRPRQLSKEERWIMTAKLQRTIVHQNGQFDDMGIFDIGSSDRRMYDIPDDRLWSLNLMGLDPKTKRVRVNAAQGWLEVYETGKLSIEPQQVITPGNLRSIKDMSDLQKVKVCPGGWVFHSSIYHLRNKNNNNYDIVLSDNIQREFAKGLDSEYYGDVNMFVRVVDESLVGKEVYCLPFRDLLLPQFQRDAAVIDFVDRKFYHRELVYPFLDQSDFEEKNEEWEKTRAIMARIILG